MKVSRVLVGTLALVLVAGLVTPAFAVGGTAPMENYIDPAILDLADPTDANPEDIVYENGDPDPGNTGLFMHHNSVAQDFVLDNSASITDVHFILVEFGGTDFDGEVQYTIFGDDNGPDITNVLGSGSAINLETEFLGTGGFGDRIAVWFDLEDPVPLDAGVTYWLHLHAGTGFNSPPDYLWEVTTEPVGECTRFFRGGNLNNPELNCGLDSWFQLTSKQVVAGELLPIDNTVLLLAGIQSMTVWMVPTVLGLAGAGVYLVKFRANRD